MTQKPTSDVTRRRLLTYIAAVGSLFLSVLYALVTRLSPSTEAKARETPPSGTPSETPSETARVVRLAEDIRDYGGIPNTDSSEAIAANVRAIREASLEATNNTVYLPEGEWFIGPSDSAKSDALTSGNPDANGAAAGLGFVGDGPEKTFLSWGVLEPGSTNTIRYCATNHNGATWQDLTYDGRWRTFASDGYDFADGGQWGILIEGDARGDLTLENVRLQSMAGNGVFMGFWLDVDLTVNRCTFYDNGMGVENATDGESVQHHIAAWADNDSSLTVTNSEFRLVSGSVINADGPGNGDGTYRIENVYAEGAGLSFHKITDNGTVINRNIYFKGETEELIEEMASTSRGAYFYRLSGDASYTPTVEMHNVEMVNLPGYGLRATNDTSINVRGGTDGPVAMDTISTLDARPAALSGDTGTLIFDEFGEMSVYNVRGDVCNLDASEGSIDTLHWGRADSLGDVGDVRISTTHRGADSFVPEVPSRSTVGINSVPDVEVSSDSEK